MFCLAFRSFWKLFGCGYSWYINCYSLDFCISVSMFTCFPLLAFNFIFPWNVVAMVLPVPFSFTFLFLHTLILVVYCFYGHLTLRVKFLLLTCTVLVGFSRNLLIWIFWALFFCYVWVLSPLVAYPIVVALFSPFSQFSYLSISCVILLWPGDSYLVLPLLLIY